MGVAAPVDWVADGANHHDMKPVSAALESTVVERLRPTAHKPQAMCLGNGYGYQT